MIELAERLLKRHEGLRRRPYLCTTGHLTIGYGRNLADRGITKAEAEFLLSGDITTARRRLNTDRRTRHIFRHLTGARQAVLIDMAVNLGFRGLMRFKRMWAALERGDFDQAAAEILESRYAEQVPRRAHENAGIMRNPANLAEVLNGSDTKEAT